MNFKLFSLVILFVIGVISAEEEGQKDEVDSTIVLTDSNFDEIIKTNNFFVMFFAP